MIDVKYEYLFNELNEITHFTTAIKGNKYRLYSDAPLEYIFRQGEVNTPHFSLKSSNPFAEVNNNSVGGSGESVEHYNAKMKIAYELKYYDTIFEQWIEFDKVIPEFSHTIKKRPDLSCFDKENNLVCCIEICFTNAKSPIDIEKLKELKVPIIEIDIKNDNKSKHIILPTLLESNKREYTELKGTQREIHTNQQQLKREYNSTAEQCQTGLSKIVEEVKIFENEVERKTTTRTERINIWLQKRLNKVKSRIETINTAKSEFARVESELQRTKNEINKTENAIQKTDYRLGKLESEAEEIERAINNRRKSFNEIAKQSKIEWFRNSWIKSEPQNIIQEIKYWLQ